MKILSYRDPDNNPSDRAEAIVQSLGEIITQIHNLHLSAKKTYNEKMNDDSEMMKLSDKYGELLKELVQVYDKYKSD